MNLKAEDIIAITVLLGCFVLLFFHRDGTVSATLTMIVGYYFGKRTSHIPDHGEDNHIK